MGEAFISKKKESFEHQRDEEFEKQLESPDLLSRMPEVTKTLYKCVLNASGDSSVQKGDRVLIVDLGKPQVTVLWKNQTIGYVLPHDGEKIRAFMAEAARKMLVGLVHSLPKLGKIFTVTIE